MPDAPLPRTIALTALTLIAFAGNSILCRMALEPEAIDPKSFTALRLISGAWVLAPFIRRGPRPWNPKAALALFVYAITFSLAYVSLETGTGALLLFGFVQFTMIGAGLLQGERPSAWRVLGIGVAAGGVVYLCLPGVSAPNPTGAVLMATAGLAWGLYSLLGRGALSPAGSTACNFALVAPAGLLLFAFGYADATFTLEGVGLALASGALTSGLGYVLWYAALRGHSATSASVVQLAVPIIAAGAGVLLLDEALTSRLTIASALTLGGVGLALLARSK